MQTKLRFARLPFTATLGLAVLGLLMGACSGADAEDETDSTVSELLTDGAQCLVGWRATPAGTTCTKQTQSDLAACSLILDCYIKNHCGPASCSSQDASCGANKIGKGTAGYGIAKTVFTDLCSGAPATGGTTGTGGGGTTGTGAATGTGAGTGTTGNGGTGGTGGTGAGGGSAGSPPTTTSQLGDATYEVESPAVAKTTGAAMTGGWNLYSNGSVSFRHAFLPGSDQITVVAKAQLANGAPQMRVSVGNTVLGTVTVSSTTWKNYAFNYTETGAGTRLVKIEFLNDYYAGAALDRNLHLDKVVTTRKFVGNITTKGVMRADFRNYWEQVTPENEGKWGSVESTRNVMVWKHLDAIYNYAQANKLLFKQHTFVWGAQQPSWLAALPPAEQKAEVEDFIRQFCGRYPNTAIIDVVNEPPPHTTPVYMNALGGATGYEWIRWSFEKARQYCPNSILLLNDYNVLRFNDADNFIQIANALKDTGLIDGLGSQSHGQESQPMAELQQRLNNLKAVGLPIYITELDVSRQSDAEQLAILQRQFTLFSQDPQIHGITFWGYVYGTTWYQAPYSGLIRADGSQRPAMSWLMDTMGR